MTLPFDRFFRDPNQMQNGSGLGLAIVKAVAQQHNSTVSLSTSAEGGLMVAVTFPNKNTGSTNTRIQSSSVGANHENL
ncbi:ATP-binding protein [Pseudomonas citronellolis]|uniref:sensor histidine kinase n=1 Tax=Pseudomonas citronellolis TaxID=53408 RepID=UPI0031E81782